MNDYNEDYTAVSEDRLDEIDHKLEFVSTGCSMVEMLNNAIADKPEYADRDAIKWLINKIDSEFYKKYVIGLTDILPGIGFDERNNIGTAIINLSNAIDVRDISNMPDYAGDLYESFLDFIYVVQCYIDDNRR